VASTLSLVLAQRLVRRLCLACRESVTPPPTVQAVLQARPDFEPMMARLRADGVLQRDSPGLADVRLFQGKGCRQCGGSGFRGRLGVFEVFEPDNEIQMMIMNRRSGSDIRATAIDKGMKTMFLDGLAKVLARRDDVRGSRQGGDLKRRRKEAKKTGIDPLTSLRKLG
jgi:type II secretory ATPase GspE/PulE/Tfp pilus assembly ATPase PilB-like protein